MTVDENGRRPGSSARRLRQLAKIALPTGAALGAGAAIAAVAAGQDPVVPTTTTGPAITAAVFPRAASSYYLEINGIKGESTDADLSGAIAVDYFDFGDEAGTTRLGAGGLGAGRVHFDELTIKKDVDSASPQLFQDSVTGQRLQKAVLVAVKDGGADIKGGVSQEYLKITLSNVVVSSYHLESQEPAGEGEVETITLDFQQINYQYVPQNADGSAGTPDTVSWNISQQKDS